MGALQERLDSARIAWGSVEAGRRRLLMWGLLAGAALVAASLAIAQARESRRLAAALQQLSQQEAQFDAHAKEAAALLKVAAVPKTMADADLPALQALAGQGVSVTAAPGGGFRLMSASMPYTAWWALCDELDRRYGLTLTALELAPKQDVKENISIDMTVARSRAP